MKYLSLTEAAKRFRIGGKRVSYWTLRRYILTGKKGIKLPAFKLGKQFLIPEDAMDRFLDALAAQDCSLIPDDSASPVKYRRRIEPNRIDESQQRLAERGV